MKKLLSIRRMALARLWLSLLLGTFAETAQPRALCLFVPERLGDFAWENDKIAFRAHGSDLRENAEDSEFDYWLKQIDTPIVDFQLLESAKEFESHAVLITETDAAGQLYFVPVRAGKGPEKSPYRVIGMPISNNFLDSLSKKGTQYGYQIYGWTERI